jgi:hypothetical protein
LKVVLSTPPVVLDALDVFDNGWKQILVISVSRMLFARLGLELMKYKKTWWYSLLKAQFYRCIRHQEHVSS